VEELRRYISDSHDAVRAETIKSHREELKLIREQTNHKCADQMRTLLAEAAQETNERLYAVESSAKYALHEGLQSMEKTRITEQQATMDAISRSFMSRQDMDDASSSFVSRADVESMLRNQPSHQEGITRLEAKLAEHTDSLAWVRSVAEGPRVEHQDVATLQADGRAQADTVRKVQADAEDFRRRIESTMTSLKTQCEEARTACYESQSEIRQTARACQVQIEEALSHHDSSSDVTTQLSLVELKAYVDEQLAASAEDMAAVSEEILHACTSQLHQQLDPQINVMHNNLTRTVDEVGSVSARLANVERAVSVR